MAKAQETAISPMRLWYKVSTCPAARFRAASWMVPNSVPNRAAESPSLRAPRWRAGRHCPLIAFITAVTCHVLRMPQGSDSKRGIGKGDLIREKKNSPSEPFG